VYTSCLLFFLFAVAWPTDRNWRWRQYVHPICWWTRPLSGVTSRKMAFFTQRTLKRCISRRNYKNMLTSMIFKWLTREYVDNIRKVNYIKQFRTCPILNWIITTTKNASTAVNKHKIRIKLLVFIRYLLKLARSQNSILNK
jgi:hypothetical protein